MGISISLKISKSVTKKEWRKVYEESLILVEKLPFAEQMIRKIRGINTLCLVRSKERTKENTWDPGKSQIGWFTCGDYTYLDNAEEYFLPRDLIKERKVEADVGDAILGIISLYLDYDCDDPLCQHTYSLWGAKTQGETYHMFLLAVACLIEARLRSKAFIYGDITRGQCKKAVEIANKYLRNKIDMPDRCYTDRLLYRVAKLPLLEEEKLTLFEGLYLGNKDAEYGNFICEAFSEDIIDGYWRKCFEGYRINTIGFNMKFREYLTLGFTLEKLCGYVNLHDEEGKDRHKDFVELVMDAKLHLPDKNCSDPLLIDQEAGEVYGIETLMAQFAFAGAKNRKVDRYIPIEDIRNALADGLKNYNDLNQIIDDYLQRESNEIEIDLDKIRDSEEKMLGAVRQDASEVFIQVLNKRKEELRKKREEYDISDYRALMFYKSGDTMLPGLEHSLGRSRLFLDSLLEDMVYKELLKRPALDRCRWLIEVNNYILLRDKDWGKIFFRYKTEQG